MAWRRSVAVLAGTALLASWTLTTAPASSLQRGVSPRLKAALERAPRQMPTFKAGMSREQKQAALADLNEKLARVRVPAEFQESVRAWQQMSTNQQMQALSGPMPKGVAPGIAAGMFVAAAVGAAVGFMVGNAGGVLVPRSMSADELDFFGLDGGRGFGFGSTENVASATALDW